jgi:hypothetical protein
MQPGWEARLKRAAADSMAGAIKNLNAAAEAFHQRQEAKARSVAPTPASPTAAPSSTR